MLPKQAGSYTLACTTLEVAPPKQEWNRMTLDLMRLYDLTCRTAIVSGGTRGIGFAIAEATGVRRNHADIGVDAAHRRTG